MSNYFYRQQKGVWHNVIWYIGWLVAGIILGSALAGCAATPSSEPEDAVAEHNGLDEPADHHLYLVGTIVGYDPNVQADNQRLADMFSIRSHFGWELASTAIYTNEDGACVLVLIFRMLKSEYDRLYNDGPEPDDSGVAPENRAPDYKDEDYY